MNPATGRPADHSDPKTWGPFDLAYRLYQHDGLAGIGFVLTGDGIVGVDLDGCRNPDTGELEPWAAEVVRQFGTYTEVSPSGTGVKLICRGQLDPKGRKRHERIEIYDRSRFFALTGRQVPGTPPQIAACQDALSALQRRLTPPVRCSDSDVIEPGSGLDGPDAELIATAFAAKNGEYVRALWEGALLSHPSWSEALLALARCLAFYTGPDPRRLERLMLSSPLVALSEAGRRKWHSSRPGGTWGRVYVIDKAINSCPVFYSHSARTKNVGHSTYTGGGAEECSDSCSERFQESTECPKASPLERAWVRTEAGEFPAVVVDSLDRTGRRLAALCWHLAGRRSGGRFFLDVRSAGKQVGCSKNTAWRRIKTLVAARLIRVLRRGRYHRVEEGRRATEFEWLGRSPSRALPA